MVLAGLVVTLLVLGVVTEQEDAGLSLADIAHVSRGKLGINVNVIYVVKLLAFQLPAIRYCQSDRFTIYI